jgi:glycosyltransferase involved in cell wall biosynthesis
VEHYVLNLVRALAALEDRPEIIVYTDRDLEDSSLQEIFNAQGMKLSVLRARRGWLRAALPWRLWRDKVNLVHLPSTLLPPLLSCPAVVTVHDLAWLHYPDTYEPVDLRMQTEVVPHSIRRAAHIITVSEATAADLRQHLRIPTEKMTAIPLGVSSSFTPEGPFLTYANFQEAVRLSTGYLLHTGGFHPRKNLLRLVDAYKLLRDRGITLPLVIAGGASPDRLQPVQAKIDELDLTSSVIFTGQVGEHELPILYRSATVVLYPSLYEGFGLPILEAMASGVPVVTSNCSSMAEVAGEAALLVDPENPEEIANAAYQLLTDETLHQQYRTHGLARAKEFTWERTAQRTCAVYRKVGGR